MSTFSEAVTKVQDPHPSVVDPYTGEVFDLSEAAHDYLVGVFLKLQEQEKQLKEWRTIVEDELVRRHGDSKAAQVVGDHEIDVDRGYTRVWNPVDLLTVVNDLLTRGLVSSRDAADVVAEVTEPKVDGRKAAQLLNRVEEDALLELRRCFTWQQKGRAKVKITPVATLEP